MALSKASSRNLQAIPPDRCLRGMQKLAYSLRQRATLDMAHYTEMVTYVEWVYITANE